MSAESARRLRDFARAYVSAYDALELITDGVRAQLRESANHTNPKTVAAALGISAQYLCDILHKRRPITRELVDRILKTHARPYTGTHDA